MPALNGREFVERVLDDNFECLAVFQMTFRWESSYYNRSSLGFVISNSRQQTR